MILTMPFTSSKTDRISSSSQLNSNIVPVFLSDAEVRVIANKAEKAGISLNEYIRNSALGFPMG